MNSLKPFIVRDFRLVVTVAVLSQVMVEINSANGQVKHNYTVGPGITTCDSLKITENDFTNNLDKIQTATWRYTQSMHLSRPYGFRKAGFYSCDVKTGFLIILIDDKKYIYELVPVSLWEEFTGTSDPDTFINTKIVGKFKMLQ